MKTKETEFFIDKAITKYQTLSIKEKAIINLTLIISLVLFTIGSIYNSGQDFGEFLYYITH
ncbi:MULTISPECIES: hypothetical protein [unclassified Polaribacter]|uniref:hypothetical protein n=1 Tax=unclassified Polaribacter TaxID=196858 RepID=UPI0011BED1EF|nr:MULTISPECIES: hypothetical protein [unclassified Polaribacter]TXD51370.1 hypothetical protein ES043_12425 [Polaribacter sp. IC063]TXD62004.1 hypothetical protein ES044_03295 [Polaribacter sp. IC066]